MVFTENQATQFYVVEKAVTNSNGEGKNPKAEDFKSAGEYFVGTTKDGKHYLQVKGADTILRSALIDPSTVMQCTVTKAEDMAVPLKKATIKFSEVHGDTPIVGQDYTMHIIVRQYQGISDEQNMVKSAAVHVSSNIKDAEAFYAAMVNSLKLNFKRELNQFFDFDSSEAGIVITEKPQDWKLGTFEQTSVYFDVYTTTVYKNGDEINWGEVVYEDSDKKIDNGLKIADMEYFYMGERGDQYRQIGWPNYVPTKYLVKPFDADGNVNKYNVLNIHFAYVGSNESVQKSEKDIVIVSTAGSTELEKLGKSLTE